MGEAAFEIAALALRIVVAAVVALVLARILWVTLAEGRVSSGDDAARAVLRVTDWPKNKKGNVPKGRMGKEYSIGRDALIGSAPKCDVRITHASVRSVHAQAWEKDGAYLVSPVQGKVKINGKSVARGAEFPFGAKMHIGAIELTLARLAEENARASGEEGDHA